MTASNKPRAIGAPVFERSRNELLRDLPERESDLIASTAIRVEVKQGQMLQTPDVPLEGLYFFEGASASLQCPGLNGARSLEIGFLDNRDCLGLPLILGSRSAPSRCVGLTDGDALCITASEVNRIISNAPRFLRRMLLYVQLALAHSAQIAFCSRHHTVEQRIARCLLNSLGQSWAMAALLTERSLAAALGAPRAAVTEVLARFQQRGLALVENDQIHVLSRTGLEQCACECLRLL
jgi:CRP-like cAMP-binding protein